MNDLLAPDPRDVRAIEAMCLARQKATSVRALFAAIDTDVTALARLRRLHKEGAAEVVQAGHAAYQRLTGRTLAGLAA